MQAIDIHLMVCKRGEVRVMKKESITPVEELVFNYAKNVLKEDIKLEDVDSIDFDYGYAKIHFDISRICKQDIDIELSKLGIEYKKINEYNTELYSNAINHVVQLVENMFYTFPCTPNLFELLKLKSVSDKWSKFFTREVELFYEKLTGEYPDIDTISINDKGIYIKDGDKKYFIPLEILSLSIEEAKIKYADILEKETRANKESDKQSLKRLIEEYRKGIERAEKSLKELENE